MHAPSQPVKVEPESAAAVSVTTVPTAYVSEQSVPQSIPAGLDVTAPLPSPTRETPKVTLVPWTAR